MTVGWCPWGCVTKDEMQLMGTKELQKLFKVFEPNVNEKAYLRRELIMFTRRHMEALRVKYTACL